MKIVQLEGGPSDGFEFDLSMESPPPELIFTPAYDVPLYTQEVALKAPTHVKVNVYNLYRKPYDHHPYYKYVETR